MKYFNADDDNDDFQGHFMMKCNEQAPACRNFSDQQYNREISGSKPDIRKDAAWLVCMMMASLVTARRFTLKNAVIITATFSRNTASSAMRNKAGLSLQYDNLS